MNDKKVSFDNYEAVLALLYTARESAQNRGIPDLSVVAQISVAIKLLLEHE